jgi:hypothetical protein
MADSSKCHVSLQSFVTGKSATQLVLKLCASSAATKWNLFCHCLMFRQQSWLLQGWSQQRLPQECQCQRRVVITRVVNY